MRGLQVHVEVQVSQPVETVWRYVVEGYFEHHSRWDPAVMEMVKLTSGPVAAGTRGREVRRFAGRQAAGFTVTDAAGPSRFALATPIAPWSRCGHRESLADHGPSTAAPVVPFSAVLSRRRCCTGNRQRSLTASHGLVGRYGTIASIPDTRQDADLRTRIPAHRPHARH